MAWKQVLEEKNRATIERIALCKITRDFDTQLTSNETEIFRD